MNTQVSFAIRIRIARAESGLTLAQLAHKSGISHVTLSQIERDVVTPRSKTILAVAKALDIPPEELFTLAEQASA